MIVVPLIAGFIGGLFALGLFIAWIERELRNEP